MVIDEGAISLGRSEAAVEALLKFGSLPIEIGRAMIQTVEAVFTPGNFRRKCILGLLILATLLSACADPVSLKESNPDLATAIMLSDYDRQVAAERAQDNLNNAKLASADQAEDSEGLRPYNVEPSIHWRFKATVKDGDLGVWAAFIREAEENGMDFEWYEGDLPEDMTEVVWIYHNGVLSLHSVENIFINNTKIYPEDVLIHGFVTEESLANIQKDTGLTAENIHFE